MKKEMFDIVDGRNRIVGKEERSVVHKKHLKHRAVHIFVFNRKGQLFIQQRSFSKDTNPGKWGSSVGGHLDAGEYYLHAAVRELKEELGIRTDERKLKHFASFNASRISGWEFVKIYSLVYGGKIRMNKNELKNGKFVRIEELKEMLRKESASFTPDFAYYFKKLFGKKKIKNKKKKVRV